MSNIQRTIGKVQVTWNGESFLFVTPQGMSGKGLTQWKQRNADALEGMKLDLQLQAQIEDVRVVKPAGTDRLTYHVPQGMTGATFSKFKQRNAEAITSMKGGYNVNA